MSRPRIGVVAYWKGYDRTTYQKAAELADDLGYDSFWVPEAWGYDVFPLLTEMALRTKRIRLGAGIVNVYSRSPGLIAMSAATIDEISGGRFMLGLGTSAPRVIEGFHGRPFDKPLSQTRDTVRIVRGLLRGDSIDQCGAELARYRPFKLATTKAVHHVPVYVAALKTKAIESAGELADGWMPAFYPFKELHRGISAMNAGAARAGRDPSALEVVLMTAAIPMGGRRAMNMAKDIVAFYVGGMGDFYRDMLGELGFAEDCARITATYADKATRGKVRDAVPDAMVEAMMVSGDPLQCRTKLASLKDVGVTLPLLGLPAAATWPQIKAYLYAMAPGKRPSVLQVAASGALRVAAKVQGG